MTRNRLLSACCLRLLLLGCASSTDTHTYRQIQTSQHRGQCTHTTRNTDRQADRQTAYQAGVVSTTTVNLIRFPFVRFSTGSSIASSFFSARRVSIARTMSSQDVRLSVRLSVCHTPLLTLNGYTYQLVQFIKHNQNYYLELDVSTSIRGLHQKKLVPNSSGS